MIELINTEGIWDYPDAPTKIQKDRSVYDFYTSSYIFRYLVGDAKNLNGSVRHIQGDVTSFSGCCSNIQGILPFASLITTNLDLLRKPFEPLLKHGAFINLYSSTKQTNKISFSIITENIIIDECLISINDSRESNLEKLYHFANNSESIQKLL